MLARSKLTSAESKISKALISNDISHEDFMTIINEEYQSGILGLKTKLNQILWLCDILFCMYKMNEIVTKLL